MSVRADGYRWAGPDLILEAWVQTRASRDEWVGPQGERLRVRITAAPVDGKANAHLRRFLAQVFRVPQAMVTVISGESSRYKRLRIQSPRRLPQGVEPPGNKTVARREQTD